MVKRTGPANIYLAELIGNLKKKAIETDERIWKRIAVDLEKPARSRRVVNLSRINRVTEENELIVVPGKVLGTGDLAHNITIAAWSFSDGALEKLAKVKAKVMTIEDLMKENAKGRNIRIIG